MTEDVANNVAQGNSQDLTEQWKKGELEEGFYYIIKEKGNEEFDYWFGEFWENSWNFDIKEVLAPVPSYEEWQELKEASDGLSKLMFKSLMNRFVKADEKREKLAEENQQLKELLLECRGLLDNYNHTFETKDWEKSSNLITKIDNAIGENK